MIKPPLGTQPHWYVYLQRIKELNEAIERYINHINTNHHIESQRQYYKAIAMWAKELGTLALLETELEEVERKE